MWDTMRELGVVARRRLSLALAIAASLLAFAHTPDASAAKKREDLPPGTKCESLGSGGEVCTTPDGKKYYCVQGVCEEDVEPATTPKSTVFQGSSGAKSAAAPQLAKAEMASGTTLGPDALRLMVASTSPPISSVSLEWAVPRTVKADVEIWFHGADGSRKLGMVKGAEFGATKPRLSVPTTKFAAQDGLYGVRVITAASTVDFYSRFKAAPWAQAQPGTVEFTCDYTKRQCTCTDPGDCIGMWEWCKKEAAKRGKQCEISCGATTCTSVWL